MEARQISGLSKIYGSGRLEIRALEDINLSVSQGDLVALMGPSGSGRSHELLEYMEVAERADYLPALLSGGGTIAVGHRPGPGQPAPSDPVR